MTRTTTTETPAILALQSGDDENIYCNKIRFITGGVSRCGAELPVSENPDNTNSSR